MPVGFNAHSHIICTLCQSYSFLSKHFVPFIPPLSFSLGDRRHPPLMQLSKRKLSVILRMLFAVDVVFCKELSNYEKCIQDIQMYIRCKKILHGILGLRHSIQGKTNSEWGCLLHGVMGEGEEEPTGWQRSLLVFWHQSWSAGAV